MNEGSLFKADISPFEFDLAEMESFTFRQDDLLGNFQLLRGMYTIDKFKLFFQRETTL